MTRRGQKSEVALQVVVLRCRQVGESDLACDVLAQKVGRTTVWARAARGHRGRKGDTLAPFASAWVRARPREEGYTLAHAEVHAPREGLRQHWPCLQRAGRLARVSLALCPLNDAADQWISVLQLAWDHLAAHRLARGAGAYPRLLALAGLMPDLQACGRCRKHAPQGYWVGAQPGLFCQACAPQGARACDAALHDALMGARIHSEALADAVEALVLGWLGHEVGHSLGSAP